MKIEFKPAFIVAAVVTVVTGLVIGRSLKEAKERKNELEAHKKIVLDSRGDYKDMIEMAAYQNESLQSIDEKCVAVKELIRLYVKAENAKATDEFDKALEKFDQLVCDLLGDENKARVTVRLIKDRMDREDKVRELEFERRTEVEKVMAMVDAIRSATLSSNARSGLTINFKKGD